MNTSELVLPSHLTLRAVVYIRQSTSQQVTTNQESLRMQYGLRQRAHDLGWPEASVSVVDADLGQSGATTEGRQGFQELVAQIALGQIGIVIAYDATRLARNCSHWYQLLDLCGRTNCLIGDRDGVYDPSSVNGRLLLGLKGQISELELHTIRTRLTAGVLNKAKRGELAVMLPTGFERNPLGQVVQTPDQEVRDRLKLVFQTMLVKRSGSQVVRTLKEQDLRLPMQDRYGEIQWREPTTSQILRILRNPAYAGAFAYGRTRMKYAQGVPTKKRDLMGAEHWKALVRDKYPAYVSWEDFEKIGAMLRDNHSEYQRRQSRGIPRDGKVLLQGIAYCGHCGRKMTIQYKGQARYNCTHQVKAARSPVCQSIWSDAVDPTIQQAFFDALSVAEIDLSARTLSDADRHRDDVLRTQHQQVERLRHAAHLVERQYRLSEPENRLVTAELERRWEAALVELRDAEESLAARQQKNECWAIPADLLEMLKDLGPRLPDLWNEKLLSWSQKKSLLRIMVEKVVLKRENELVHARVVWRGGDVTEMTIPVSVGRFNQLPDSEAIQDQILTLARAGQSDRQIAEHLTKAGYHSPRHPMFLKSTVNRIRIQQGILHKPADCPPRIFPGCLRPHQLAQRLKIRPYWIYDRLRNGTIQIQKNTEHNTYLFPDTPETLEKFRLLIDQKVTSISF